MKKYQRPIITLLLMVCFPLTALASQAINFTTQSHLVWVMLSALLVLFMTIPGITLFYGGMVQRKNVLSIYAQCVTIAAIVSILWFFVGYSLVFDPSGHILRSLISHVPTAGADKPFIKGFVATHAGYVVNVIFQMGFAIITVAIIVGGFAERMKFSASIIFAGVWLIAVYCPIAHWVWGEDGWLKELGLVDFAGGAVVHLNAGIAGLIAAVMVGERHHKHDDPYSLSLVTIGTSILWIAWFGFNGGSAHALSGAIVAVLNTQLAPAGAILGWMATEWWHRKKPSARGLLFGVIAGLVVVTPMAGVCSPLVAIVVGIIAGFICYWSTNLKRLFGYDDALDAFGIHGIAGMLGAVLTAIAMSPALNGAGYGPGINMIGQLGIQLLGILTVLMWSGCVTFIILWVLKKTVGLRVEEKIEMEGLDYHEHGEAL